MTRATTPRAAIVPDAHHVRRLLGAVLNECAAERDRLLSELARIELRHREAERALDWLDGQATASDPDEKETP